MFTRLDSERNAKNMKKAVNEQRLSPQVYQVFYHIYSKNVFKNVLFLIEKILNFSQEAVQKMDSYVSLPAKRLAHLVHKYVHHCQMKKIEGKSKYFNIAIMAVKSL